MAVDDVQLFSGQCPVLNSCDFESSDLCSYKNDATGGSFSWVRQQASDSEPDQSLDNSFGHYMIAKSVAPHTKDRKARLLTPSYTANVICLRFWYKLKGDVQFNVRIFTRAAYSANTYFNATGDRGSEWSLGKANILESISLQVFGGF